MTLQKASKNAGFEKFAEEFDSPHLHNRQNGGFLRKTAIFAACGIFRFSENTLNFPKNTSNLGKG